MTEDKQKEDDFVLQDGWYIQSNLNEGVNYMALETEFHTLQSIKANEIKRFEKKEDAEHELNQYLDIINNPERTDERDEIFTGYEPAGIDFFKTSKVVYVGLMPVIKQTIKESMELPISRDFYECQAGDVLVEILLEKDKRIMELERQLAQEQE